MPEYPTLDDLDPAAGPTDSAPAPAPPTPASSPARSVLEWLESEGFRARIDEEGDVHLRHEGRDVFVVFDADDPAYVRILAPAFWNCGAEPDQRFVALAVANRLNAALKVAKISLRTDGAACVAVELFVDGLEAFRAVLPRCLDLVGTATWQFREAMKEAARNSAAEDAAMREPVEGEPVRPEDEGETP
ncbi:MAG TPA: YbjN domain-containing protein [Thermoanaerobaculia bacterium]|nr:YbjN domain-containing protein [Thermoanaerobaculia bacterium]